MDLRRLTLVLLLIPSGVLAQGTYVPPPPGGRRTVPPPAPPVAPPRPVITVPPPAPGVRIPPPPPRYEEAGARPGWGQHWIRGWWEWRSSNYEWRPGYWTQPPAGRRWVDATWTNNNGLWVFTPGYWSEPPPPPPPPPVVAVPPPPPPYVPPPTPPQYPPPTQPQPQPHMVPLPAAVIRIGATDLSDASPVHEVSLNGFSIDRTEVTVSAYSACVDAGICTPPHGLTTYEGAFCTWGNRRTLPNHPVNCVDWNQASQFCQWARKRLPNEEEWEYAARGQDFRKYPWGNQDPQRGSLCWDRGGSTYTCEVGSTPTDVSPFGIYDMAGNMEEWTASRHCPYANPGCDADRVVIRGGNSGYRSYGPFLDLVRTARRRPASPGSYDQNKGFRCAR